MKSSPEPIWKQHRRIKEGKGKTGGTGSSSGGGGGGGGGGGSGATAAEPVQTSAAAGSGSGSGSGSGASSSRESQIQTGRKLTQKLGKVSAEGKFSKDGVLEALQRLGELDPSVELLQQSGCGKAVASIRKYYFGGQVKHNDKDVAAAASTLRGRWMDALGKG
ncbi:unnamed protein product, partial [Laminaria digitata]